MQKPKRMGQASPEKKQKKGFNRNIPNHLELSLIYRELFEKPNVRLCFIGKKTKDGMKTPHTAIVCAVESKARKVDLSPDELVPRFIPWLRDSRRPRKLRTDVIEMPFKFAFQQTPVIGPGDSVIRSTGERATLGIAVHHPEYGPVVTTAGHLFLDNWENEAVRIQSGNSSINGKVMKRVQDSDGDYALIKVEEPSQILNLFRDRYAIGPMHNPEEEDLDKDLRVLISGIGPPLHVTCQGIHGFLNEPGGPSLHNLILTECITQPGHSGSGLIGMNGAVWGLLIGTTCDNKRSYSAFMPVYRLLSREQAEWI